MNANGPSRSASHAHTRTHTTLTRIRLWLSASPLCCFAALKRDRRPLSWAVPEAGMTPAVSHRRIQPNQNGSQGEETERRHFYVKSRSSKRKDFRDRNRQRHFIPNTDYDVLLIDYFQTKLHWFSYLLGHRSYLWTDQFQTVKVLHNRV